MPHDGVLALVDLLRRWGEATPWCDWIELAGSLGRGAHDELSDVDAGCGIRSSTEGFTTRRDEVLEAIRSFAPVADSLVQTLGTTQRPADHLIVQYADGRQLSLVVMPADGRAGLPPEATPLLDRSARLADALPVSHFEPTGQTVREWAFLAWIAVGDAAKHAHRGRLWRALRALDEARDDVWRLWAHRCGITFPAFGVVSVENAAGPWPDGIAGTVPAGFSRAAIEASIEATAEVLAGLTDAYDVDGVRSVTVARLRRLGAAGRCGCSFLAAHATSEAMSTNDDGR